ncbi:MAG: hypothetical protein E7466_04860 [Ruminococcaceae bacterium]|nr:hypothetical protein [Oscillospiraceae bacterium]
MTTLIYVLCFIFVLFAYVILDFANVAFRLAALLSNNLTQLVLLNSCFSIALPIVLLVLWGVMSRAVCKLVKKQEEKSFVRRANKVGRDPFEYAKASVPPHVVERCEEMIKQSEAAVVGYLKGISDMGIIKKKQAEILIDGYSKLARQVPRK